MENRIKLFTHTDLDGIGCGILAKYIYKGNVDIEYCNYDDVNTKVGEFLLGSSKHEYENIFITDISVNEEVANIIEREIKYKTVLLDHHPTALWLNKYSWARVEEFDEKLKEKTSGTWMLYNYLDKYNCYVETFSDNVRKYDTWQWKRDNDLFPKKLNDLFHIYGRDLFIEKALYYLESKAYFIIGKQEELLLKLKQDEINKYIESKNNNIIEKDILGYKAGVVFAEMFTSELGSRLSEMNPNLDFIAMINLDYSISYRSIKDNVNLSEVAKHFKGGGHPKASGSPIPKDIKDLIVDICFKGE